MLGSLFALTALRPRTRVASAVASSLAGMAAARPLGDRAEAHHHLADLHDVRIVSVTRKRFLRKHVVEVLTAADV